MIPCDPGAICKLRTRSGVNAGAMVNMNPSRFADNRGIA